MILTVTIADPDGLQLVGASLVTTLWVLLMQYRLVNKTRRKAGIEYPQMYADRKQQEESKDALIFNCAQRAHQNTLENLPLVYVTTILTGLYHPKLAALACTSWSIGRVAYTNGYVTGDPSKRIGSVVAKIGGVSILGPFVYSSYLALGWFVTAATKAYKQGPVP
ncbi:hypothetical protein CC1G_01789 [Coprinopsis cinerea okayama7|uniref:Membrane-associated proteins in eicosanoid and glutathione metabolism n=1 Tax=Coprinopsis cinerea (strain Okayama-7 / 130 / ATCC MYA-4618 / FGSC 9003) TaxID=240176 RepID=A8N2P1_COPC7|nr:hypothetical protein CC1G_01789 [Coprinopsis cinerea okayama7\|eukprot:XP_001829109.2 hypothetical protein CC1G_01789 [Coprinopsis cinerea okayama7\